MTLITEITNAMNAVDFYASDHQPMLTYFGLVFNRINAGIVEQEMAYQLTLATPASYQTCLQIRTLADMAGVTSTLIDAYTKSAMDSITFFTAKHLIKNWTYSSVDYYLFLYRFYGHMCTVAKNLNYDTALFDPVAGATEVKNAITSYGKGVLCVNPVLNTYRDLYHRLYDENLETMSVLAEFTRADPANNANILTYMRDTLWVALQSSEFWYTDHYSDTMMGGKIIGDQIGLYPIIGLLRALNGMTLTNWSNVLTDMNTRLIGSGWNSSGWYDGTTSHYAVLEAPPSDLVAYMSSTMLAWLMLHAYYPQLNASQQTAIQDMLTVGNGGWYGYLHSSNLWNLTTHMAKWRSSDGATSNYATCEGIMTLILMGVVPITGNINPILEEMIYESDMCLGYGITFNLTTRTLTLPLKAGNIKFIYGSTPFTVNIASDGLWSFVFASDWNSCGTPTKIGNLDPTEYYITTPSGTTQRKLTIQTASNGHCNLTVGDHYYDDNASVSITAIPDGGYQLDHWMKGGSNVGNSNPLVFTITADVIVYPVFAYSSPTQYTLTIQSATHGACSLSVGDHVYNSGTDVPVTSQPDGGYTLDYWLEDSSNVGSADPIHITMTANHTLQPVFKVLTGGTHTLTIGSASNGHCDLSVGGHTETDGSTVNVLAIPDSGYVLDYWTKDSSNVGSANPYGCYMDTDHTLTPTFKVAGVPSYVLTMAGDGHCTTTPSIGTHTYTTPTNVGIDCTLDSDRDWDHWIIDGVRSNSKAQTINVDHSFQVTAYTTPKSTPSGGGTSVFGNTGVFQP
jgi:hypothetical protein